MTREDVSRLSDEELQALAEIISEESEKRERESARFAKGLKARAMKRDPRCPECAAKLWRDGKRKDGVQTYVCPKCGKKSCDASGTSLASSKMTMPMIEKTITLIMLDCPNWVVSWILGIDQKTAQFWRDRCLDASQKWSAESTLSKHVWIDEMRFAPTRAKGLVDGVWSTCAGKIAKDADKVNIFFTILGKISFANVG
mgnify:FL=1